MAKLTKKELEEARKKLKDEARQRIIERGILQFRADPVTIDAVLKAADEQRLPVSTLLRNWVQEKLLIAKTTHESPDLLVRVAQLEQTMKEMQSQYPVEKQKPQI